MNLDFKPLEEEIENLPESEGVYIFSNKHNAKKYVGVSVNVFRRVHAHFAPSHKQLISRALKKYGKAGFDIAWIKCENIKIAKEVEAEQIQAWHTMDKRFGYNQTSGGEHHYMSEEWKKEHSKRVKGKKLKTTHPCPEWKKEHMSKLFSGEGHPLYGTHRSEETKEKIRKSLTGRKMPEEQRLKLVGRPAWNKGKKASAETRAKQSAIKKEQYKGKGNPFYGKKHTEETKQKIRDGLAKYRASKKAET